MARNSPLCTIAATQQNVFDRVDFKPSQADTVNLNVEFTRSWFQTPNSYDAQNATAWSGLVVDNGGIGPDGRVVGPQDQRSKIRTLNFAPTWTRLTSAHTVFTFGGFVRQDQYNYYPSPNPFSDLTPDLQLQTVGQNRTLTNLGLRASLSYAKGVHNLKIGATYMDTIVTEKDGIGIVDPTNNAPCLNSDGSPYTDASLTDPAGCSGMLQPNPAFVPLLGCYDLTRTGTLPGSDWLPQFHQRPVQLLWPCQHPGTRPVRSGHHHQGTVEFQPGAALRLLRWHRHRQPGGTEVGHRLQHQAHQHGGLDVVGNARPRFPPGWACFDAIVIVEAQPQAGCPRPLGDVVLRVQGEDPDVGMAIEVVQAAAWGR